MRRHLVSLAAALVAAAATTAFALADNFNGRERARAGYSIGLWGDLPYSDAQKTVGVPNLIADMNASRLAFTVHDGDIKSGSSPCTNDVYTQAVADFNALRSPAMYTPGDNEWTDCDRQAGVSSGERLQYIRTTMFDTQTSFGQRKLALASQAPPGQPYTENRRWQVGGVVYATLNVPGSDNNLGDVAPDPAEEAARDAKNRDWLAATFTQAQDSRAAAVLLVMQADPGFDRSDGTRAPTRDPNTLVADAKAPADNAGDGYDAFLHDLRALTIAFGKPVALVHGDSHYFRIDKPLLDAQGKRIEGFTRVETFGDNQATGNDDVQWLKVTVDPGSREVFSFQPEIVPGNVPAYDPGS